MLLKLFCPSWVNLEISIIYKYPHTDLLSPFQYYFLLLLQVCNGFWILYTPAAALSASITSLLDKCPFNKDRERENAAAASSTGPARPQLHKGGVSIFVEGVWYLLWCGKGACWLSKRRWPCGPRRRGAVEDEKPESKIVSRASAARLPSHSAARKQATSPKYMCDVQRGTKWGITWQRNGILKPDGKRKKERNKGGDALSCFLQSTVNTMLRNHLYTQFNPHLEGKKPISNTFSPLCSILKNASLDTSSRISRHAWSGAALPISG